MEEVEAQLTAAQSQYIATQEQLDMINTGETKENIGIFEAQVKQAQAALEYAQIQLNNGRIVAPISGVVNTKNISNGEMALPGQSLLTILNVEGLHIDAYIPIEMINQFKVGQDIIAKVSEIADQKFQGKIYEISPDIDSKNKSILVKISIADENKNFKARNDTRDCIKKAGAGAKIE